MLRSARFMCLLTTLALAALSGCVGYSGYPPVEGDVAFRDPNANDMRLVQAEALKWVARNYPPGELWEAPTADGYAINLPAGVRDSMKEIIRKGAGPNAHNLTLDRQDWPIYHVSRIRIRGDHAKVDIVRPVRGWASGRPQYQGVTVDMRGGLRIWRVRGHKLWTEGAMEVPQLNFYDLPPQPLITPSFTEPEAPADLSEPTATPAPVQELSPAVRERQPSPEPPEQTRDAIDNGPAVRELTP